MSHIVQHKVTFREDIRGAEGDYKDDSVATACLLV